MIIDLRLQKFRSYQDDSFEFDQGVNIVVGPNASGKTNLLEAILLLCVGRSYRVKDAELVKHGEDWARLDGEFSSQKRTVKLLQENATIKKQYQIDEKPYLRLMHGKMYPVVLFEPNNLLLLSGSPEHRREYLDNIIEQIVPGFGSVRRQYKRALAQRNALLKTDIGKTDQMFAWNIRLGQLGGQIVNERLKIIEYIQADLQQRYNNLAHSQVTVEIRYITPCQTDQYSSDLLYKLEQSTARDAERGFTTYGPHREDFGIWLKGYPTAEVASRGEVRTLLLALKMIEMELLENHHGKKPLLLLDDVFSELDGARRRALTEVLHSHQTFITTTDADVVLKHFSSSATIVPLGRHK